MSSASRRSPVTPPYDDDFRPSPKDFMDPGLRITPPSSTLPVPSTAFSPPATPRSAKPSKTTMQLRSNSGLSLHTNEEAFRRYTDYNPDGSPRSPTFGTGTWSSLDGVSTTLRCSFGPPLMGAQPTETLPIPDFLGREVFQMVLNNVQTSRRFFEFARTRGCGPDIEFLLRVQEYARSLSQFGKHASSMPTPTNLPSPVAKSLSADMRQLTGAVLPGLDALFAESTRCVEQRVARSIYPAFVKHQLAICTSASLNGARNTTYPGLGDSFCLTDALSHDYPIVAASDAFMSVTGYSRAEALPRNCRFLQGALTDPEGIKRIRQAVSREEESVELVLNYRRDGTPFWNLLFTCPLLDTSGQLRYHLGGQVDVSESIGGYNDVLRILNFGPALDDPSRDESSSGRESRSSRCLSRTSSRERKAERRTSLRNRDSLHNKGSKKSIFQPFRKNNNHSNAAAAAAAAAAQADQENAAPSHGVGLGLEHLLSSSSGSEELLTLAAAASQPHPAVYEAYSRFIVLQHTDGAGGFPPRVSSLPAADASKRKAPPRLSVAFCSAAAVEALGLGAVADSVTHRDVFAVLSDLADSPSITKSFRNTVRERVVRDGKAATLDMMLGGGYLARKGSLIGLGRSSKDGGGGEGGSRKHGSGRPVSRSGFASLVGDGGRMEKLTSYWTPLKNAEDKVEWVVVVITPMK
ncbi:Blue-light-activated histidine kinase 1 [Colletotrichum orbiculare MAFF 240422]|uniref:Blue-light-activated histidine kinase 1 n=1 Tax=Colletotrichum orbiculare (strain 104-T / ATCC 96160 / CBS 514.97 / LARS 414 / MAFF 240422) TaxID=1213857 RepID=N4UZ09_COLOR|nr:Blue-light-activated histidine kinase 1 [Colletotrichum orbiculare MAFF 240422]